MQAAAKDECRALMAYFERELGDRKFFCGENPTIADFAAITHVPLARSMRLDMHEWPKLRGWIERMRVIPAVEGDHARAAKAWQGSHNLAAEFEGPDGKIHWRDARLEWPVRHGFIEVVAREFRAGKMLFPPDAA